MEDQFSRTRLLLGRAAMQRLWRSRVAVFGIGGVGGHVVEGLIRSGVGAVDLIDDDCVTVSNINRQIIATHSTVGMAKVDAAAARVRDLSPHADVRTYKTFFTPETASQFDFSAFDYVVDAIDTVTGKIALVECASRAGTRIISSMGAGNKMDPTAFEVADIYKTSVCPLARVMRHELKKRGIKRLKVVYSKEIPMQPQVEDGEEQEAPVASRRAVPGSNAFVPSVVGLIIAGEVVKDLIADVQ